MAEEVILRFNDVTFEYVHKKPIIELANFRGISLVPMLIADGI